MTQKAKRDIFYPSSNKMAEKIYIKTYPYIEEFVIEDIKSAIGIKAVKTSDCVYEIEIDFEKVFEVTYKLINLSRTIVSIYMRKIENTIGEYNFLTSEIEIKGKMIEVYDLSSSILEKRSYLLHESSDTLNHFISCFCFFKLGLHKKKSQYSIIDPFSNFSEIILEAGTFSPRKPIYVKERYEMQLYQELRKFGAKIPNLAFEKDKNKYYSIVSSDKSFKYSRENMNRSGYKIKISKVELEWLDLKHEEKSFDFVISLFPIFKNNDSYNNFLKEYFTQAKYLCRQKICVVSREKLSYELFEKHKLKVESHDIIKYEMIDYNIYILK